MQTQLTHTHKTHAHHACFLSVAFPLHLAVLVGTAHLSQETKH